MFCTGVCYNRNDTLTTAVIAGLCPNMPSPYCSGCDRRPTVEACDGNDTEAVRLALANGMFSDCNSLHLYDFHSPSITCYKYTGSCWHTNHTDCVADSAQRLIAEQRRSLLCGSCVCVVHRCGQPPKNAP